MTAQSSLAYGSTGLANRLILTAGPCPKASNGVHHWLWRAGRALLDCPEDIAHAVIRKVVAGCGRLVTQSEILNAIRNARTLRPKNAARAWPLKNPDLVHAAVQNGMSVSSLVERSPVRPAEITHEAMIDRLFPGDASEVLLCVGETQFHAVTRPKCALRGLFEHQQFIVPSFMSAPMGKRQDGKWSQRCLGNTGPRRFLVVESDPQKWDNLSPAEQSAFGTKDKYLAAKKDEAASVLWHLAECAPQLPLVMVVDSGGKSLHGWFLVAGMEDGTVLKFFRYAVALGADPATWTRCQWVRMPGGARDNGNKQSVLYFNPAPMEAK